MLPAKTNYNNQKNTRANSKKQVKTAHNFQNDDSYFDAKKSKNKSKQSNCARNESDTGDQLQPTINTGLFNRRHNNHADKKATVKKSLFQTKPIIKQFSKKLNNFSKQYAPEYFTTILQYMIQKQAKSTISPNAQKIKNWRVYLNRQKQIEKKVKKQVGKMASMIITSRKKLKEELNKKQQNHKKNDQNQDSVQRELNLLCNQRNSQSQLKTYPVSGQSNQDSSNIENISCPQFSINSSVSSSINNLTNETISKQWNSRYEAFAFFIQAIEELLGQQQSKNTIFPACYFFYSVCVADTNVFNYLSTNNKKEAEEQLTKNQNKTETNFQDYHLVQYYIAVSTLIASKYHEIYPVSLLDLIDSINPYMSFQKAVKIEGQILQMMNFTQFYSDNQLKFLKMFATLIGWSEHQIQICQFIAESGLNNPKLYAHSPMYKAASVISIYEDIFLKTQEKFMLIRNICPGLTAQIEKQIKKQYLQSIYFNFENKLNGQRKKYIILQSQIRNLIKRSSTR